QCEIQRIPSRGGIYRLARDLPRFGIHYRELRLIVQHLLVMRNAPFDVGGIAMEPAAYMVMYAAARHRSQCPERHIECRAVALAGIGTQQKLERHGPWKLRRTAKPAVFTVVTRHRLTKDTVQKTTLQPCPGSARFMHR